MDYSEWFADRLAALRMQKGVSARDMSLTLGQSESYINKIENRRALPSMAGFFYICEYLEIQPQEFFDPALRHPKQMEALTTRLNELSPAQLHHILQIVDDILGR